MLGLGANVWQLQTTFVNPLTQVRDGTRRFGAGDLTYRLNFSRADEIGQLARTFDEMAGQLQAQQQALQDLNASLEIRVVNRTEELQMERDHAQAMSARHQALLDAIPDLIFRISNTGVYLDYKANLKDDLLAPAETFLGKTLAETLPPDIAQQSHTALQEALASDTIQAFEYQLALPAGPQIFEARLARSGPQEVTAIVRNITERKQAEAQLQASLQEKEVLLKEVHHRVKNNLQVISSLLQLQSRKITDPQLLELFRESQNRVAAMALIHEQLYQASNFAGVDFGAYAHTLGLSLIDSYGISRSHITLTVEAAKLALDINQAIPCGLILNEALSNSLKYAFPNGQRGHITIALSETSAAYRLKISDDGIGLPPSPSTYRPGSLGLRLINRLVSQLGGTLEHLGPPGTIYQIQFPNPRMD
jgi:two-component sensor histidine kinase/HAMP domain-containing protein